MKTENESVKTKHDGRNKTLGDLVNIHGKKTLVIEEISPRKDPDGGQSVPYNDDLVDMHWDVEMMALPEPHTSADGVRCYYASDWIAAKDPWLSTPFRYRILLSSSVFSPPFGPGGPPR